MAILFNNSEPLSTTTVDISFSRYLLLLSLTFKILYNAGEIFTLCYAFHKSIENNGNLTDKGLVYIATTINFDDVDKISRYQTSDSLYEC